MLNTVSLEASASSLLQVLIQYLIMSFHAALHFVLFRECMQMRN